MDSQLYGEDITPGFHNRKPEVYKPAQAGLYAEPLTDACRILRIWQANAEAHNSLPQSKFKTGVGNMFS
jgi:hypothetical protein